MNYTITRVPVDEDYIQHHGILGMKWGHRKVESSVSEKVPFKQRDEFFGYKNPPRNTYTKYLQKADRSAYGKRGQKRIQDRIDNKGASLCLKHIPN